ncbi:hypothetical protein [Leptospira noguchii]|uniref:hypothetical protein n=1 Tax=Leptospira noguchii TaxID=28182 RepID=UPI0007749ED5|nr:hypothetical protein [Leptospira noguchii]
MDKLENDNVIDFREIGTLSVDIPIDTLIQCEHNKVSVINGSAYLKCRICLKDIDPIWFLKKIALKEGRQRWLEEVISDRINDLNQKFENQNKLKCEHCGKFTRIIK